MGNKRRCVVNKREIKFNRSDVYCRNSGNTYCDSKNKQITNKNKNQLKNERTNEETNKQID